MTLFITFLAFAFLIGYSRGNMRESKRTALLFAACVLVASMYFFFTRFL
jgi:hypothetical protein